jgi:hypothetical protein
VTPTPAAAEAGKVIAGLAAFVATALRSKRKKFFLFLQILRKPVGQLGGNTIPVSENGVKERKFCAKENVYCKGTTSPFTGVKFQVLFMLVSMVAHAPWRQSSCSKLFMRGYVATLCNATVSCDAWFQQNGAPQHPGKIVIF